MCAERDKRVADETRARPDGSGGLGSPRVEISLDALGHNLGQVRAQLSSETGIMAVVKDSAYGCGALPVARHLRTRGVSWFVVARVCEARALRQGGIDEPILVLGDTEPADLRWAADNNITVSLNDIATLASWQATPHDASFHCNIDTGMGRMGLAPDQVPQLAAVLGKTQLRMTGLYTHFACADESGSGSVAQQLAVFESARRHLLGCGIEPAMVHCANSAAIAGFTMPEWATHARPGIALYGCRPAPRTPAPFELRPVASLVGRVVKVKRVPAGAPVSYGWHYRAERDTTIATVDLGYGHGFPRFLSSRGTMLVRGEALPIAGRVTMDFTMLDVGPESAVRPGDEAVAIGTQGGRTITPDDVAVIGDTIGYEVLCNLSARIPRVYRYAGKVVEIVDQRCW
ncbi:MAG: alanine racemase [Chitinivibrionales bacterium]|nr:alanine racemase [Chitinivibrionales bacterium]